MPVGIPPGHYFGILGVALCSMALGSFTVHYFYRPDVSAPDLTEFIDKQREIFDRVRKQKHAQQNTSLLPMANDFEDDLRSALPSSLAQQSPANCLPGV